jgi:hypothetical protein
MKFSITPNNAKFNVHNHIVGRAFLSLLQLKARQELPALYYCEPLTFPGE